MRGLSSLVPQLLTTSSFQSRDIRNSSYECFALHAQDSKDVGVDVFLRLLSKNRI